jgi:glycerol-3-phosphate acyltransferase PlsY
MVLLLFRHRKNVRNLLAGKEDKIGKKPKPAAAV